MQRAVYAVTLVELREKEKRIERDLQDGIDSSKGDMTLNQMFQIYMETKSDLRESTRYNYMGVWKNAIESTPPGNMKIANLGDGCKFHIQDLKTEAGRRDIPLTENARKSLIRQKELRLLFGKAMKQLEVEGISDFVFTSTLGKPYAVNAVNFALDHIVKAYNKMEGAQAAKEHRQPELLPHISAHILRHTACTRLVESGLEPKVLQYIMGHANVSVTLDVYTHLDFTKIQEKMEAVQENMMIG